MNIYDEQFKLQLSNEKEKGQCLCDKCSPEEINKYGRSILRSIQRSQLSLKANFFSNNISRHDLDKSSQKVYLQSIFFF